MRPHVRGEPLFGAALHDALSIHVLQASVEPDAGLHLIVRRSNLMGRGMLMEKPEIQKHDRYGFRDGFNEKTGIDWEVLK
ncbi:hypothetical protein ACN8ZM_07060 [Burkholderia aenigmatica]|uniref:hypothetical protein n=1 Tax=Burkholderia aenigmatica TaxID=2015348 RepID=UPI003B42A33D